MKNENHSEIVSANSAVIRQGSYLMGAVSPLIAGALYQYSGMRATLLFVAVLFACSAIIFSTVDINKKA